MSPRAKKPKRGGARPGAGRPRTLEPPEGSPEIRVRLDKLSGMGLLLYYHEHRANQSEAVRELLTAYGDSVEVRMALARWKAARG